MGRRSDAFGVSLGRNGLQCRSSWYGANIQMRCMASQPPLRRRLSGCVGGAFLSMAGSDRLQRGLGPPKAKAGQRCPCDEYVIYCFPNRFQRIRLRDEIDQAVSASGGTLQTQKSNQLLPGAIPSMRQGDQRVIVFAERVHVGRERMTFELNPRQI